jgi:hypothetical protein
MGDVPDLNCFEYTNLDIPHFYMHTTPWWWHNKADMHEKLINRNLVVISNSFLHGWFALICLLIKKLLAVNFENRAWRPSHWNNISQWLHVGPWPGDDNDDDDDDVDDYDDSQYLTCYLSRIWSLMQNAYFIKFFFTQWYKNCYKQLLHT